MDVLDENHSGAWALKFGLKTGTMSNLNELIQYCSLSTWLYSQWGKKDKQKTIALKCTKYVQNNQ